jgi:hypothetical protein
MISFGTPGVPAIQRPQPRTTSTTSAGSPSSGNSRVQGAACLTKGCLGSNQRRLSRRFYSPSLLAEADAADQHIRRSRPRRAPSASATRPYAPGLVHGPGRKRPRTGGGGSGYADRPPGWCF